MSQALRPKLAALIGAATLSATSPAAAEETSRQYSPYSTGEFASDELAAREQRAHDGSPAADASTLRTIIEDRIGAAEEEKRYGDIDELATLWLTLSRREQLDRVVDRGEQFVNVALKNQRRSELRVDARMLRRRAPVEDAVSLPSGRSAPHEAIDAERFVQQLDEPYRTAVQLSLTGMNHREVAEQMGASHAAVRKWAQRLREGLAADDDPPLALPSR